MTHVRSRALLYRILLAMINLKKNPAQPQAVGLNSKPLYTKVTRKYHPGEASSRPFQATKTFKFVDDLGEALVGMTRCDNVFEPKSVPLMFLAAEDSASP